MNCVIDYAAVEKLVLQTKAFFQDNRKRAEITQKGKDDFVTQVDFAVQSFLQTELGRMYPDIQFLGEEGPKEEQDWSRPVWILDPVDGTTNLIRDLQMSAVSLGLWDGEDMLYGCVYNPYRDEMCTAVRGQGTKLNGEPVTVSKAATLSESLFVVGTSPYEKELYGEKIFERMKRAFMASLEIRRTGSAALDLVAIATGRADGYFEYYLKPWDCAAGILLVKEAGGRITDFQGNSTSPDKYPDLVASNGLIHDAILKLL